LIARGRTAEIFACAGGRVLKLFLSANAASEAEHEAGIMRKVRAAGLPIPAVHGIMEAGGRPGIVMERVEGPSMLQEMTAKPWRMLRLARLMAELHASMHSLQVTGLPSLKEELEHWLLHEADVPADVRRAALKALQGLPDGTALCHGDFHPDNIIMTSRGPVIIDWQNAKRGQPPADVIMTSLLLTMGAVPSWMARARVIAAGRSLFQRAYLRHYLRLRPEARPGMAAWRLPITVARLADNIPEERERLMVLIARAMRSSR
jgi:aminoglycoside phosphotransferase (APT) family kinase protein